MVRSCCSKYSARDLNRRIAIERKERTADGMGGVTEVWLREATVWAMWKPLSGSEQYRAMREKLPKEGKRVSTSMGDATVVGGNPLQETVLVELESETTVELPLSEVTIIKP